HRGRRVRARGGHARAASATISGVTLKEARQALEDVLKEQLKPGLTARQIMSHPVHSIRQDLPVEEAQDVMLRLGHQGMPVTNEKDELVGIITRSDIDKAVKHELTHAPVKGFMNPGVVTIDTDTGLHQIQNIMMNEQIGRLPVVEDGKLIGIVTRTDLIRILHEMSPEDTEG
ncbi:MAG: CBS domain-containing protein, partial [bacterium]